jgi:uncharacterized protein
MANSRAFTISVLGHTLAVCRLPPTAGIPSWAMGDVDFWSISRTREELSIICSGENVPEGFTANRGWRALKVEGPFDFEAIGVMVSIITPLSSAGISVLPVATYDTDYVLVQEKDLARASQALRDAGHTVLE